MCSQDDGVRVWHDDVRPPPDGWLWVRTNEDARKILKTGNVQEISLDHDMGLDQLEPSVEHHDMRGRSEDNGMRLVEWMVANALVPESVVIHSWNLAGARSMYLHLNQHGYGCVFEAYTPVF
jgi:hypothetical protein